MAKRIIEISINDEYVIGSGVVIGAAGSHNDVVLRVTFNEQWDGLYKYATFRDAQGYNPTVVMITALMLVYDADDPVRTYDVPIPASAEAIEGQCNVTFSGFTITADGTGEEEMDTATNSATAKFRVLPSEYSFIEDEEFKAGEVKLSLAQLQDLCKKVQTAAALAEDRIDEAIDSAKTKIQESVDTAEDRIDEAIDSAKTKIQESVDTAAASAVAAEYIVKSAATVAGELNTALKQVLYGKSGSIVIEPGDWTGDSTPYSAKVTIQGIGKFDIIFVYPQFAEDCEVVDYHYIVALVEAEGVQDEDGSYNQTITFTASNEKPSMDVKFVYFVQKCGIEAGQEEGAV